MFADVENTNVVHNFFFRDLKISEFLGLCFLLKI